MPAIAAGVPATNKANLVHQLTKTAEGDRPPIRKRTSQLEVVQALYIYPPTEGDLFDLINFGKW